MRQDTNTVHTFTGKVITYIKEKLPAITQIYFCEEETSQNKNFINLCYHEVDHGIKAKWHFLRQVMESHLVMELDNHKQFVARSSLQATENSQILTPNQMFQ